MMQSSLRVRENKAIGPYVEGLSSLVVPSFERLMELLEQGNRTKTIAATAMNVQSSSMHLITFDHSRWNVFIVLHEFSIGSRFIYSYIHLSFICTWLLLSQDLTQFSMRK
jgi:hypothetical protein